MTAKALACRLTALLLSCGVSTCVSAQDAALQGLRGLNDFGLLIESLDSDAEACGLERSTLETSVKFILQQSKMRIKNTAGQDPYIYVLVTALNNCAAAVELAVVSIVTVHKTGKIAFGARIWNKGSIATGARGSAPQRVAQMLEGLTKQLVVDWASNN